MHHPTDRITHTTAFVTPVVEHWLEREIAQWFHLMKDRSDDPSHHELTNRNSGYSFTGVYIPCLVLALSGFGTIDNKASTTTLWSSWLKTTNPDGRTPISPLSLQRSSLTRVSGRSYSKQQVQGNCDPNFDVTSC